MNGKLNKLSNGRSSYDVSEADENYIFIFANILRNQYGFDLAQNPVPGLDGVYWEAAKDGIRLTIGWDIWSGAFVFAHCSVGDEYIEKIAYYFDIVQIYREWYDNIIEGFKQDKLSEKTIDKNIIAEYRVVYDASFQGYDYYSFQVFADETGSFRYMVHKSEDFETGEIILNKTKSMDSDETRKLLKIIKDNDFFGIPVIQPNNYGLDGTTIFIEGYDNAKLHFIRMWEADEKYNIYKIYKAFADLV